MRLPETEAGPGKWQVRSGETSLNPSQASLLGSEQGFREVGSRLKPGLLHEPGSMWGSLLVTHFSVADA